MNPRRRARIKWLLAAVLAAVHVPCARADVVAAGDQPMTVGVRILALEGGRLSYRLPDGRVAHCPIDRIGYLQITGWDDFNAAERALREKRFATAVAVYETLLAKSADRDGRRARSAGLDRRLLVMCRLLQAYEAAGRFDKAVVLYVALVEAMPGVVEMLRPAKLPAKGSTFLPPAERVVRAAIQRHRGTALGRSLEAWLRTWPGHGKSASTTRPKAPSSDNRSSPGNKELQARLARAADLVMKGRYDEAIERLAAMQNASAGALRPEVFYWLGRAWAGRAADEGADQPGRDRRRAGLAFMRVVIHYPRHALAAESLWRAGQLCLDEGRPDLAAGLWRELVRTYPDAVPWSDKASTGLKACASSSSTRPSSP